MSPLHEIASADGTNRITVLLPFITAMSDVHDDPVAGFRFWVCLQGNETRTFSYVDKDVAEDRRRYLQTRIEQWWEQARERPRIIVRKEVEAQ